MKAQELSDEALIREIGQAAVQLAVRMPHSNADIESMVAIFTGTGWASIHSRDEAGAWKLRAQLHAHAWPHGVGDVVARFIEHAVEALSERTRKLVAGLLQKDGVQLGVVVDLMRCQAHAFISDGESYTKLATLAALDEEPKH